MITEYVLNHLDKNKVDVRKIDKTNEGVQIGSVWGRNYINSQRGREEVQNELPQAQQNAIFAVWGDTPTVTENSDI